MGTTGTVSPQAMDEAGSDRSKGRPGTLLVVAVVAAVVALSVVHFAHPTGWVGEGSYLAVTVSAAAAAWFSYIHFGSSFRLWLAMGLSCSALGDASFRALVAVRGAAPDASVADGPWIASYVGVGMAMLLLLRRPRATATHPRDSSEGDAVIDMAVIALVAGLLLWEFWLNRTFTDGSVPVFVRCVWGAYPILDTMLLALVVRTLVERRTHTWAGVLLALGVGCWLVSDFVFMILVPAGLLGVVLDVGWMTGAVLLAGAGMFPTESSADAAAHPSNEAGRLRIALAIAPLLVPGFIELIGFFKGVDANPIPLLAATVAFAGLTGARAMRLMRLRDEARSHLTNSEQLYRALAANSSDAVMMLDANGLIVDDVPSLADLVGYPGVSTRGHRALDFVAPADEASENLFDRALLAPGVVLSGEHCINRPDHTQVWLATRVINLLDTPAVGGIVVNVHDITARKQAEDELTHQAFHDSLTGLANRSLFRDRVEHALARRLRTGMDPAVIYLDLDGFKNINDSMGHEAGDNVLCAVAARLLATVRSGDTVARLGGDEFAVLLEESPDPRMEAELIAERVQLALAAPILLNGCEVTLSASLGITHADAMSSASSLLRDADVAMYQAKSTGRARWVVYEPRMRAPTVERLQLETDLAHAVELEQLRLVYQPVVELKSNRLVGFEALVRWDHPRLGEISPDRFIPIAEENGMIIPIGRWVLQTACRTAAGWASRHTASLSMAVNLSGRQLASPDLLHDVREALSVSKLAPAMLVLEMTETSLVRDPSQAAVKLHELRTLGVRLAIDDFGTGYSSLTYLRLFPVDILKIDRSFINTITDGREVPAIVRGLLALARTLHLETVAEGIETETQLDELRTLHCDHGQGYLFDPPLSHDAAETLVQLSCVPGTPLGTHRLTLNGEATRTESPVPPAVSLHRSSHG